jgi:hypothetical protein
MRHGDGVRTSILRRAMEWPDLRAAAGGTWRRCRPHLLIRFGYGPDGVPAPRAPGHVAAGWEDDHRRPEASVRAPGEPARGSAGARA